jgi:hypothetical protein
MTRGVAGVVLALVVVLGGATTAGVAAPGVGPGGLFDADGDGVGTLAELWHGTDPFDPDTDGDGLRDAAETSDPALSPTAADTDVDGLADPRELRLGTAPNRSDTDADGLVDSRELRLGTDPLARDTDGDGLGDGGEVDRHDTDPLARDTDGDGLPDGREVRLLDTDPTTPDERGGATETGDGERTTTDRFPDDADDDRLRDAAERRAGTDPTNPDTDGDGRLDGAELAPEGTAPVTDPLDPDTDGDGLPDGFEVDHGLDPRNVTANVGPDEDGDGLGRWIERRIGTSTDDRDTDGDGLWDGPEVFDRTVYPGASPLQPDLYVEVDRTRGARIDRERFAAVEAAYEEAPVESRVGEGIDLHFVIDHEDPTRRTVRGGSPARPSDMSRWETAGFDRQALGYRYLVVAEEVTVAYEPGNEVTTGSPGRAIVEANASAAALMHETGKMAGLDSTLHPAVGTDRVAADRYPSVMNENYRRGDPDLRYDNGTFVDEWARILAYTDRLDVARMEVRARTATRS